MAPSALRFLLCLVLPSLTGATRASPASYQASLRTVEASHGVPKLSVLRTSKAEEAAAFIAKWSKARRFGLFVQVAPSSVGLFQQRVAILGISQGEQVLLYDLRPFLLQAPRPLPRALEEFLEDEEHTFFGAGLLRPVAQLTREFGLELRSIDLKVRGWPEARARDGLYHAADHLLGISLPRAPSLRQLTGQAVYTYLQWAVADGCLEAFGEPDEAWVLTAAELADTKAVKLRAPPRHDAAEDGGRHRQAAHTGKALAHSRAMRLDERRGMRKEKRERFATARERGGIPTRLMGQPRPADA